MGQTLVIAISSVSVRYIVDDWMRPFASTRGKQILLEDPTGNPIELFEPPKR